MTERLHCSIEQPIRKGLTWSETWRGPDNGLIWCWELGRQKRIKDANLADRAGKGELVVLGWKGGVTKKLEIEIKHGSLNYLAEWQGLRGEDVDIALDDERAVVCTKTGQAVVFSAKLTDDEE